MHLDRGKDSAGTRATLAELALNGVIARKGTQAPLQAGQRWVVERTQSWMNGFGKLHRCTERAAPVVDFPASWPPPSSSPAALSDGRARATGGTIGPRHGIFTNAFCRSL